MTWLEYLHTFDASLIYLLKWGLILGGVFNIKAIVSIFKGKDGWQLKELGAIILIILAIYMVVKEGTRDHDWHYYNEWYIGLVIGGAIFALGFEKFFELWSKVRNRKGWNPAPDSVDLINDTNKELQNERG